MKARGNLFAAMAVFSVLIGMGVSGAWAEDVIARFNGTSEKKMGGQTVLVVALTMIANGKNGAVPVPNDDPKKPGATPKKDLNDAIKKFNPGQMVKFTLEPNKELGQALSTIEAYDMKPGEDTPNGYVFLKTFDKTVGKNTLTTVVLTKFGVEHNFTIAVKKGEKGEQEQDPDVTASLAKITEGNGVWVQTQGKSVITAIEPYTEPQTGKISKIAEAEVDGHKVKSADIDADGKAVTVYVPGKESGKTFLADPTVTAELAKVKVGSQVEFRVHEDGDKLWLREIEIVKPGPKKPADAKPMPAAPAKK